MAISIDWATKIISVPKADMSIIGILPDGNEIRELNLDWFRKQLKALEASEAGAPFEDTHRHNTEVFIGNIILARVVEIINGYTVVFEDGNYAVELTSANSNVQDVTNLNQVSVRSNNTAGLIRGPANTSDMIVVKQSYSYDQATDTLQGNVWVETAGGLTVPPVTAASAVLRDIDGNDLFAFTVTGPDAYGVFKAVKQNPGLARGRSYSVHADVTITGIGTAAAIKGGFTFGA